MWHNTHHSNQHGRTECFDPGRERPIGWHQEQNHCGDGGGHSFFPAPAWGGDCGRVEDPGWGGVGNCHDDRGGWGGGFGDCHDGGRALISFDHNSILACH